MLTKDEVGGRSCVSHYKRIRITLWIDNHPATFLVMHIRALGNDCDVYSPVAIATKLESFAGQVFEHSFNFTKQKNSLLVISG